MIWPFHRSTAKRKKKATPLGIFLWALLLCAIAGAISMPEPLEDIYRGGRNMLRARPADQSIVVVAVDDKTVAAIGTLAYSRSYDAKVVEQLFAQVPSGSIMTARSPTARTPPATMPLQMFWPSTAGNCFSVR